MALSLPAREIKYEVFPGDNIEPPVRTEAFFAYSETHLYVAFKAYDPKPSEIRASVLNPVI